MQSNSPKPFWRSDTMRGESLFFIAQSGELPIARLLFEPLELFEVQSASGEMVYEAGRDYQLDRAARTLVLPEKSRIPFVTATQIRPPQGSPHTLEGVGTPERGFLWSEGHFFHDLQTVVIYTHDVAAWKGPVPACASELLSKTLGKLRARQPLNLVVLGDSVSVGYNASGFVGALPQQPAYPELFKRDLERTFGAQIKLTVFAAPGETSHWGLQQIAAVNAATPDLVVLAFGLNDSQPSENTPYIRNTRLQIEQIRADRPNAEFVIVAPTLPNPDLSAARIETLLGYQTGLAEICEEGVALANATEVWAELLKHKNYLDISGNGINHPNDFGHRVLAQILFSLFTES